MGANSNFLYNFGRDYKRFGRSISWSAANGSLSGGGVAGYGYLYSPWANSRAISLGSSKPEDYGSAIRQASFVEAFSGFRNDPLMPYTSEYILPFSATYTLGAASSFSGYETVIPKTTWVLGDVIGGNGPDVTYLGLAQTNWFKYMQIENLIESIGFDALLRGSEDMLIGRSGESLTTIFPSCLVDYNVNLQYFIGQRVTGANATGALDTPHTDNNPYSRVADGIVEMVPAHQTVMTNNTSGSNKIPLVATKSYYEPNPEPANLIVNRS
jgi:hypothetical protein